MPFLYTPNLNLGKPDLDEPGANWWSVINGNFDTIDTYLNQQLKTTDYPQFAYLGLGVAPNSLYGLYSSKSDTDPSGNVMGLYILRTKILTVGDNKNCYGGLFYSLPTPDSGITDSGSNAGVWGISRADGEGTVNSLVGARGRGETNHANATGVTVYGLLGEVLQTLGTINTGIGCYIGTVQGTTKWGFYQSGTENNYLAGKLGVGGVTPTTTVHLKGNPIIVTCEDDSTYEGYRIVVNGLDADADLLFRIFDGANRRFLMFRDGRAFITLPPTAPNTGVMKNSDISFYVDESGNNLKCKVKYSDGTIKTGTYVLT